ncbi:hypothetical protein FGU71_08500 [Erythrobacter insulae]|uniref:Uncharacterized protein n=1 Tax=Erythrobacter insulae TaxID=2584124 RepID=A0A547PCM9_9SPHN|nr:hypothetical protein [Erythrobacter insulae]TRD11891.1 hypothetical protein FGU71_08500 [Erythrobacter insulae]
MTKPKPANSDPKPKRAQSLLPPSPNAATNLLIADIVVRGASSLFRKGVEKRVVEKTAKDSEQAQHLLDGRSIITTLALYGASKMATKSPVGLGLVAGGLVLKTLYDRGKDRQQRRRKQAE